MPLRLPQHPGRFLQRQCLAPLGLTQTEAARVLGISRRRVNEIVQGHRGISPDTAIRCALAFGVGAEFWLGLQSAWDVYHGWQRLRRVALRGQRPLAGQGLAGLSVLPAAPDEAPRPVAAGSPAARYPAHAPLAAPRAGAFAAGVH
ncbi:HigA protein [Piscinibacter sakaiensis]|uniref:HigA protein n=1 Tax=Piscinibacter sakaiensis TaxID=1547922 RepID=A0A0K8P855_PISS1|nr:HigA protein [Piscinibacter sakaiensis]